MTREEWFKFAKEHRQELSALIGEFHPMNRSITGVPSNLPDLAENPEKACQQIRREVREKWEGGSPLMKFDKALESNDYDVIVQILNETWFGVPESASYAWSRTGFKECVALLEDPVETEDESRSSGETNGSNS